MIQINDFSPWDKIERVGYAYHGWWLKDGDGNYHAISRFNGSEIALDSATMAWDVTAGPCWLTKFSDLPEVSTSTDDAAVGLFWTNWAVFGGQNKIYNPIRNTKSDMAPIGGFGTHKWPYRCDDGTVYWLTIDTQYRVIRAVRGGAPNADWGTVLSSNPSVLTLPQDRDIHAVNWSPTGRKAALALKLIGGYDAYEFVEVAVSGGSSAEIPIVEITRHRRPDGANNPATSTVISELLSTPTYPALPWANPPWYTYSPTFGGRYMEKSGRSDEPADNAHLIVGVYHARFWTLRMIDYDGETSVDIGDGQSSRYTWDSRIVNYTDDTIIFTGSSISTTTFFIVRGSETVEYYKHIMTVPEPSILVGSNDPETFVAQDDAVQAEIVYENPINIGPPHAQGQDPKTPKYPAMITLFGKYYVLAAAPIPYYTFAGKRYYSYSSTTTIYGWAAAKSGTTNADGISVQYDEFSLDPIDGQYRPGVVGYF